ncbi:hypothetical protein DFH27DRAFT_528850 [Peziza echinospora]|nr:hypothetical protein DFH27DRAFT_528850 [Peziza echinospora]
MVLLEQFLEEFNMFVRLQLVALLYHHYRIYLTALIDCTRSQDFNLDIGGVVHNMAPNRHARTYWSASNTWSTINMVLLEQFLEDFNMFVRLQLVAPLYHHYRFLEEFNMFVRLQLVALLYHHYRWLHCPTITVGSLQSSSITIGQVSYNIIQLDLHALFRQVSSLEPISTHDKHSNVPGLQLEYWWSCAQRGSKLPWSHILECKQHMVNHQYGVVGAVPGGVQHVCSIAAGCTAIPSLSGPRTSTWIMVELCTTWLQTAMFAYTRLQAAYGQPSIWWLQSSSITIGQVSYNIIQLDLHALFRRLSSLEPTSTHDKHFNVTLSEWNLGLLDMFVRMQVVVMLYHRYRSASSTWSTINMVLLEQFLEEFNMFVRLQLVALLYHHYRPDMHSSFRELSILAHTSTQDKHSNVTLSEWNLDLLDGPNRLHQVPGLQLGYWWSCAQHGSKPPCSHILECKQHMVNHQYGVVGAVPGGLQHVCSIAAGCTALPSLSEQHFNVTLSEWNQGLLDGPNRLHQVPGLQLEYWWSCAQRGSKLPWLHMLECKQHMVNHQYGVVGAVPGGVQHVCSIAAGCTALPSLSVVALPYHHCRVPGLQLEYWWSCAQRGSKPPWSHILECKQHMGNHQYGVVGAVPGGVQHVCSIAAGCTALPSLSVVALLYHRYRDSNLNIGGVVHNVAPNRHGHTYWSASSTWSTINMVLLEQFLEEFNMFVRLQLVALLYHHYRPDMHSSFRELSTLAHTSTQDKHSNVTLSEWNLDLLDGPNRLH